MRARPIVLYETSLQLYCLTIDVVLPSYSDKLDPMVERTALRSAFSGEMLVRHTSLAVQVGSGVGFTRYDPEQLLVSMFLIILASRAACVARLEM